MVSSRRRCLGRIRHAIPAFMCKFRRDLSAVGIDSKLLQPIEPILPQAIGQLLAAPWAEGNPQTACSTIEYEYSELAELRREDYGNVRVVNSRFHLRTTELDCAHIVICRPGTAGLVMALPYLDLRCRDGCRGSHILRRHHVCDPIHKSPSLPLQSAFLIALEDLVTGLAGGPGHPR